MTFPLNIIHEYKYQNKPVDNKFVSENKDLFPRPEDVQRYYQEALSKTLRNKKTIFRISETGITTALNVLDSDLYDKPNDR